MFGLLILQTLDRVREWLYSSEAAEKTSSERRVLANPVWSLTGCCALEAACLPYRCDDDVQCRSSCILARIACRSGGTREDTETERVVSISVFADAQSSLILLLHLSHSSAFQHTYCVTCDSCFMCFTTFEPLTLNQFLRIVPVTMEKKEASISERRHSTKHILHYLLMQCILTMLHLHYP